MKWSCFFYFLIGVSFLSTRAGSQAVCGFDYLHQQRLKTDPNYRQFINNFEKSLRARSRTGSKINSPFADTIPVVVHVVHAVDTIGPGSDLQDARIQAAIEFTNKVFAGTYPGITGAGDIGIRFALAQRDPNCNPTNGIDHIDGSVLPGYGEHGVSYDGTPGLGVRSNDLMDFVKWDPYRYYNIWVVNTISTRDLNNGISAYSYYPTDANQDGTIIMSGYLAEESFVLAHELGHAFFLYHTFEGSSDNSCPINDNCESDGDHICDTDPISKFSGDQDGINPCTNTLYSANTQKNIMNYVCCRSLFTEGQKMRMQQTALTNILRDTLSKSLGRIPVDAATVCSFTLHLNGKLIQNDIFLDWQDPGNNGYHVERSSDGINFTIIGFVSASKTNNKYSFHDAAISQQRNYYRLRQNLPNGKENYSNTLLIKNPIYNRNQFVVLNNPVNDYIDIQLGILQNIPGNILQTFRGTAEINLFDMSGRELYKSSQSIKTFQRLRIPSTNLPRGIYILQVSVNKNLFVKKIVKI